MLRLIIRRFTGVLIGLVLGSASRASPASLGRLGKAYFPATKPGTFAKYERTTTNAKGRISVSTWTISRLEDEDGRIRIEVHMNPGKKRQTSTLRYVLKPVFRVDKDALDYRDYIDRIVAQDEGTPAREIEMEEFRVLYSGFFSKVDYASDATPKGTENVDGRNCDRYGFAGKLASRALFGGNPKSYEAEVWLNDAVPFGRVKQSMVVRDREGKLVSSSETRLLETGSGAKSQITGPVLSPDPFGGPPA